MKGKEGKTCKACELPMSVKCGFWAVVITTGRRPRLTRVCVDCYEWFASRGQVKGGWEGTRVVVVSLSAWSARREVFGYHVRMRRVRPVAAAE